MTPGETKCLTEDELAALCSGAADASALARVDEHIDECPVCREAVIGLARAGSATDVEAVAEVEPPTAATGPLPRGTTVGRYVILSHLGAGGMGVVYAAHDPELDRKVAIKLVRPDRLDSEGRQRLLREARALARLAHPNVVAVHDAGTFGEQVFIAMEHVAGPTLRRWQDERRRGWREIRDVYLAAGQALASAHALGIVHRDFKPENVMIGADGRVRVLDFGLARAEGSSMVPLDGGGSLGGSLTTAGAIAGTPAYMAPEQKRGAHIDARADQYAFAVAFLEALTGVHPSKSAGKEPRRVPGWLRAALAPALARDPAGRYPTIEPLLARLDAGPRARRRALALIAAGATVAILVVGLNRPAQPPPCRGAEDRLAGVWDPAVAGAVRSAFLGTGRSYAAATYAQAAASLDGYARGWARMRTEACEAAVVRREQSPALYDLRMACLDRRLAQMTAVTRLFARAPAADVLDRAVTATRNLGSLDDCADARGLLAAYPPPEDRLARVQVAALRGRLDHAGALAAATRTPAALALVAPIVAEARALDYPPVVAEALGLLGRLQKDAAPDAAVGTLTEAVRAAGAARDDVLAARALEDLIWTYGLSLKRVAEARALVPAAEGALLRAGDPPRARGALLYVRAVVEDNARNSAEARRLHEEALALRERSFGPDDADVYRSLVGLGILEQRSGNYAEARRRYERALDLCVRTVGPSHPYAMFVLLNLGSVAEGQGRNGEALALQMRALAIALETYGPDHPYLAPVLGSMAFAQAGLGHPEVALANLERARAVRERAFGADSTQVAETLAQIADIDALLGRVDDALAGYRRAIDLDEKALGPGHPDLARPLAGMGEVLLDVGRARDARPFLERALALQVTAYGADSVRAAAVRADLAQCALDEGDVARAVALAEAAVPVIERAGERPAVVGRARFALARALWADGHDRARALGVAEEARHDLEVAAAGGALARASSWLAARR